ncbi:unnamed protein product [Callosobruchus maculatus]|uniref:Uncharacterized protein n=1 Tax=Callosobruchus maculatus TaxID=64391 RepID=A0A653D2V2_CALMS|nr:unnamed protein product [Callosobruchus maculatus]
MRRSARSVLLSRPELLPVLLPHLLAMAAYQRDPAPQAADAQLKEQPGAGRGRLHRWGGGHRRGSRCRSSCGRRHLATLRTPTSNLKLEFIPF